MSSVKVAMLPALELASVNRVQDQNQAALTRIQTMMRRYVLLAFYVSLLVTFIKYNLLLFNVCNVIVLPMYLITVMSTVSHSPSITRQYIWIVQIVTMYSTMHLCVTCLVNKIAERQKFSYDTLYGFSLSL